MALEAELIEARAAFVIGEWTKLGKLSRSALVCRMGQDIPALIAWIEKLEARQVKLVAAVAAVQHYLFHKEAGHDFSEVRALDDLSKALADLGEGDG